MNLHDIAPRLAQARDEWVAEQQMLAALSTIGWHLPDPPTCPETGKLLYPSRLDARDALAFVQNIPGRRERRIYRCEFCSAWHLTSKAVRTPRARRVTA